MDAGYQQENGYLGPYGGARYHLDDFRGVPRESFSHVDAFNYVHSRLRTTVERSFGVLKRRWKILGGVPPYGRDKLVKMVIACFALNNFLWDWTHAGRTKPPYPLSAWAMEKANEHVDSLREAIAVGLRWFNQRRYEKLKFMHAPY